MYRGVGSNRLPDLQKKMCVNEIESNARDFPFTDQIQSRNFLFSLKFYLKFLMFF